MMFDRALLAFGNLLFLTGVVLVIGLQKTMSFFFQPRKMKGTALFLGGITLVLFKWPIIGMCIEIFGFINLFGDFLPIVLSTLRRMPVIGSLLMLPGLRQFTDNYAETQLPV
eukprot:CAMPEP_0114609976 /NCGR_PEP_ID=MMETSP0168-20121206/3361_1 /TAXON_ID=95228 ORGANISM="Vannella sp., Strain DIVA3 517/6/12" /NCGR_SAMPLE_ID=MMETSP0168 /ASSEMBLY_ACC=CAM_ASM_000044 /LENGTH=111 /DNA_ID=CAMNT_0001820901 /DNA_START=271 /DNA_END=606 /DNA_ORIENTATION=-